MDSCKAARLLDYIILVTEGIQMHVNVVHVYNFTRIERQI